MFDPDPPDDMTLDVHAEDVRRVGANLGGVRRELDPAGLASPTDLDLRLHDDRIADAVGGRHRVVDVVGDVTRRDGNAIAREQLLPLILEQVHRDSSGSRAARR